MLSLRAATPADCATIAGFIRELADYEKLLHECHVTPESLMRDLFGPRVFAEVIVACWTEASAFGDGEGAGGAVAVPVGFALFFHNYSTFVGKPGIYLEDLYVQPMHRSKGIGKAMLRHLAMLAVERNCGRLEWSVLDWNAPSIAFYKSLGAVPMDEWTTYRLTGDALTKLAKA